MNYKSIMRSCLKLVIGTAVLGVLSPGLFAATCTTWTLGDGLTTIAPETSAGGTSTGTIPCTLGSDTFSSFYVYNAATSGPNRFVDVIFASPAVMTFNGDFDESTDLDIVFEVAPSQSSLTISDVVDGTIATTVCSVVFVQGQSCTGQGGVVLGSTTLTGDTTTTIDLAASPTGDDWIFEDAVGTLDFTNSFSTATTATPEPGTLSLMLTGVGLLGLLVAMRKRVALRHPQST